MFKNCVPFADCISEINNTQIDIAKDRHYDASVEFNRIQ